MPLIQSTSTAYIDLKRFGQSQRTGKTDFQFSVPTTSQPEPTSSTQVSISQAAKDAASSSTIQGHEGGIPIPEGAHFMSLRDLIASGKPLRMINLGPDAVAESKLHDEQVKAREAAIASYAQQHPDTIYGQVFTHDANGNKQLFGTVWSEGSAGTPYPIPMTNEGSGQQLAQARLEDIAKAVNGTVVYSDFIPVPGDVYKPIPDSVMASMPQVTARSFSEILADIRESGQLDANTITFTTVEQYDAYQAGNFTSAQQWNDYLKNQASLQSSTVDTSA